MAQMKRIGGTPQPAPAGVLNEWLPFFEGPVVDRVQHLVERERHRQRGEAGEKPRERRKQPLQQREQRRKHQREHGERIPGEERSLALLRLGNRKFVLDEKNPAPVTPRFARDPRERMVQRVLLVKPPQEGDGRRVQHVAVKEILDERVDQADGDERDDAFPGRREELRGPNVRHEEPQGGEQARQGRQDGENKEREGKFFRFHFR